MLSDEQEARLRDARDALNEVLHEERTPLYWRVWEILEERFVDGSTVDLNTAKGQATMQSAVALIIAAMGDVHALDLDAH